MLYQNWKQLTFFVIGMAVIAGCSDRGLYESGKSMRVKECESIVVNEERQACFAEAEQTYHEYKTKTSDTEY